MIRYGDIDIDVDIDRGKYFWELVHIIMEAKRPRNFLIYFPQGEYAG